MVAAGAREIYVTTTGGPEQFLTDPAINNRPTDEPVVLGFDGDNIVVEPEPPTPGPRRTRRAIAAAVVAVLAIGGVAVALASRSSGSSSGATKVQSLAPVKPPAAHPTPHVVAKHTPSRR